MKYNPYRLARCVIFTCFVLSLIFFIHSCGGNKKNSQGSIDEGVFGPNVSKTPSTFRGAGIISDAAFLIGGPMATGRVGDLLVQNDHIRFILQKPTRNTGINSFGGNLVDADIVRPEGESGEDQFGAVYPMINVSWTSRIQKLEILNGDFSKGPVVVRATGKIDVYDYIQASIIVPFAKALGNPDLFFDKRFNDLYDPFQNIPELRNVSPYVVTDYILRKDKSYVTLQTHLFNEGEDPISLPFGDWVIGSGTLENFIPRKGFLYGALQDDVPGVLFSGLEDTVRVSYGYFYNPEPLMEEDGTQRPTGALNISGMLPIFLGETFLDVIPLAGSNPKPNIHFKLQPGTNTVTRYFSVGSGDVDTALAGGYEALGVSKVYLKGTVKDLSGNPVSKARVIVSQTDPTSSKPVSMIKSDSQGNFSGVISSGTSTFSKQFGSGKYVMEVYKEGFLWQQGPTAGKCSGGTYNQATMTVSGIQCSLGSYGTLSLSASENGNPIPARVTIVGFDPSPIHDPKNPENYGKYTAVGLIIRPYGVVDVVYIGHDGEVYPKGNSRVISGNQIRLEPGQYKVFITRGMEYSVYSQTINLGAGANLQIHADLNRVLNTPGYVSADLHYHGINSTDSPFGLDSRVRAALGEGMDIVVSTDHDFVTDYGPVIDAMGAGNLITSMAGNEITPLAFGHFLAFPLKPDSNSVSGGGYDYTVKSSDEPPDFSHDMVQSSGEFFAKMDEENPGTQVFQVAHIHNKRDGHFKITGLVTSTLFPDVEPLSTYADPVNFRMSPNSNADGGFKAPYPLGTSELFSLSFTAVEVLIGADQEFVSQFFESTLPTYFNLLNLGVLVTATGDSDSHTEVEAPMGLPRNFIRSSTDPKDGIGASYAGISQEEIAVNTNDHHVVVSVGPMIFLKVSTPEDPEGASVGDTIVGSQVKVQATVKSIEYIDWDTLEIYANTDTLPAMDAMDKPYNGPAKNFHVGIPLGETTDPQALLRKYFMTPAAKFTRGVDFNQNLSGGLRSATISKDFNFNKDTWIVVVVRAKGNIKSIFPLLTASIDPTKVSQAEFLDKLDNAPESIGGVRAFAFTNPVFVDVDGNGFMAKHVASGLSPLAE